MTSEYWSDALSYMLMGMPIGAVLGYAFAKAEIYFSHHRRH